ncbi:YihY/virulence factor BrkB family protein [Flavihumibacter fluvii]|uniref:YihY/virulence factor BrkB family protein n=1 Tax=Flavihumibacter fluvii TaxID=2838157 RepID=UPI001BDF4ADB|nr:YihY/virulence factor BrkB family protein [Flavihumibacter fluvii]ULQ51882.1 YihY/virulence factor BrkB family protein [Flavihumibacter fluvii]
MINIRKFLHLLVTAAKRFAHDDALKLSASLSYYTIFAMGPLLLIVISLAGILYGREAIQGKLFGQIKGLVGNSAAYQLQSTIASIEKSDHSTGGAIVGFIILLVGATGVFTEIQGSINYMWSIKATPKKGWIKLLFNRFLSFTLLAATSFILMVALVVNAVLDIMNAKMTSLFPEVAIYVFYIFNLLTIFLVITILFAIIFKVLPDARIAWKDAFLGAGFTAILFLLGKLFIGIYLGNADFGLTYGTAASIMILLVWVYYSSVILYFGAAFTNAYAITIGQGIAPNKNAVYIIKSESKELNNSTRYGSTVK